jgi:uncharacterized membrane protein
MSFLLLMVAFVLTGVLNILNKALIQWHLGPYRDLYMLAFYATPALLGTVILLVRRQEQSADDKRVGFMMGAAGAISMVFFLLALQGLSGIVVFPVRSLGNLVVTAVFSIIAWRERLSISQKIGIGLSLIAIWLIY